MSLDEKIDVKFVLHVLEKIVTHGHRDETREFPTHQLEGIFASSDLDGYNVVLFNEYVSLTIQFHSKYVFEYNNQRERLLFLEKLEHIQRAYSNNKQK
ncbi:hypothetical protein NBRC116494_33010 [Aurantivibrio plasticivorans]